MIPFLKHRSSCLLGVAAALAAVLIPSPGQARTPKTTRRTNVAATSQAVPATTPTLATLVNEHVFAALNGLSPTSTLATDGTNVFGTTTAGGANSAGTVFEIAPDGTITTLYSFGGVTDSSGNNTDGTAPNAAPLVAPDGFLYGTTTRGGANSTGTVYRLNPATGALITLASFNSSANPGSPGFNCVAPLVTDGNGNFYGVAQFGGVNAVGTLFVYNAAAGTLTAPVSFSTPSTGSNPQAALLRTADGNLYGTTAGGGSGGSGGGGTVFQFNPTTGALTVLQNFNASVGISGGGLYGSLATDGMGNFYGTANSGGGGQGTLFKLAVSNPTTAPSAVFTRLYAFSTANSGGGYPYGGLVFGKDGNLYGTASNGGSSSNGTTQAEGTVFQAILPTGNATTATVNAIYSFTGGADGYIPNSTLVVDAAGDLLGTTSSSGAFGQGSVFKLTPSTATPPYTYAFSTFYNFPRPDGQDPVAPLTLGSDGNLYGTTVSGGNHNDGTVFVFDPTTGVTTTLYNFRNAPNDPVISIDGTQPNGRLVEAAPGVFYGTTPTGGTAGKGTVFQLNTATDPTTGAITGTATLRYSFTANLPDGQLPMGGITLAADGFYYGTTQLGGANGSGTIFRFNPAAATGTASVTSVPSFTQATGNTSNSTLLSVKADGNLYGTTTYGGANGAGTIFQFNPVTGALTTLVSFNSANGAAPNAVLIQGMDGNLYGTAVSGGTGGPGTLFQMTLPTATAASTLTTLVNFGGARGSNPVGAIVQAADGDFYGTTENGGANGDGTAFQFNPNTGAFASVLDFGGAADFIPFSGLTLGANGNLYGTTSGGTNLGIGGGPGGPNGINDAVSVPAKSDAATPNAVSGPSAANNPYGTIYELIIAPTITSGNVAVGTVGAAFSFQVTATSNPTAFTATGLPTGLTIAPATGVISGTPTATGTSSVTVTATNAGGSATQTLTIVVQPPTPPAVPVVTSGAPPAGQVGTAYGYQITASGTPTSYGASGLPAGLTINPTTGLVSGTPTAAGSYGVTILATNSGGTGTASFTLTILPLAPAITSAASANAVVGQAFSYQITATNGPTSFTATGLPPGLTSNSTAGLISGTPTTTGTSTVTISATNAGGTSTASLTLVVSNAPVTTPIISSAASASATAGTAFSYQIAASNNPTGYGATGLPTGLTVNTTTGLLSGTPTVPGSYTITLNATNAGGTGTGSLALTVTAAATPPTAPAITSPASASAQTGAAFTYQITASGNPTSFAATGLPAGLTVNPASGLISGTPTATGSFSVTLSATGPGGTGPATLTLTVTTTTVATPTISSPASASAQAGQAFSYQVTASNRPTGFTATGLPDGLAINTATGLISGTPVTTGAYTVGLSVTNAGGTSTANVALTVTSAAVVLPVISSAASAGGQVAVAFSYQITASNHPVFFGATGLPAGLSIDDATGVIAGTPTAAGIFTVNLLATNSAGSGTAALTLTIAAQPLPVVSIIASIPSVTLGTGQLAAFALTRTGGDSTQPLVVNYSVSGTATAGVDYLMLKGTKKFKADKTTVVINVTPEGTLNGAPKRTVKVTLLPGDGYTLGTATTAKAKIVAAP